MHPSARYVLPSFVERTSYGIKESNPYNKLFEERIIFLGVQIDDASADDVMAQLLCLESMDPDRDISIYINSPAAPSPAIPRSYGRRRLFNPRTKPGGPGRRPRPAPCRWRAGGRASPS